MATTATHAWTRMAKHSWTRRWAVARAVRSGVGPGHGWACYRDTMQLSLRVSAYQSTIRKRISKWHDATRMPFVFSHVRLER
eukprot:13063496-Alexandrium_andersonii.AAC.1